MVQIERKSGELRGSREPRSPAESHVRAILFNSKSTVLPSSFPNNSITTFPLSTVTVRISLINRFDHISSRRDHILPAPFSPHTSTRKSPPRPWSTSMDSNCRIAALEQMIDLLFVQAPPPVQRPTHLQPRRSTGSITLHSVKLPRSIVSLQVHSTQFREHNGSSR